LIAASHSEIILNEAADRDIVVAFLGKPHRIDDRGAQLAKSLKEIGFDQYYQAEQKGWILYVEGSTDFAILKAFAERLDHRAKDALDRAFVHYIDSQPGRARSHFHGLRDAKPDLVGFVLCDRLERPMEPTEPLNETMWRRREIENYLCQPETLLAYARAEDVKEEAGPLFTLRKQAMQESIDDQVPPIALRDRQNSWWRDVKASDDFLDHVFVSYLKKLALSPSLMRKSNYHVLANFVPTNLIDSEVVEVLDKILAVSERARPAEEPL
jgi:hypothetical protein